MKTRFLPAILTLLVAAQSDALALDVVRTTQSSTPLSGTLQSVGATEVVIQNIRKEDVKVPVNTITSITFTGEAPQLRLVRSAIAGGNYDAALRTLANEALDPSKATRVEIKQEILFFRAISAARLALAGGGSINDAGRELFDFVANNKSSWRYYEANLVLGDIFVADGKPDQAQKYYDELVSAPWDDFKMRGGVAKGRALQVQGKHADALKVFDGVLKLGQGKTGDLIAAQTLAATVGKAACLAETGDPSQGVALIEGVIKDADAEQAELHAVAYVTLGNCYRKAGKSKPALLAFLHVDVLYYTYPKYHAEALYNLAQLFREGGKGARAGDARKLLLERYGGSKWAKMK